MLGAEASAIHLDDHVVELHGGEKLPFDKLLLAAGAHPFIPPLSRSGSRRGDQPADRGGRPPASWRRAGPVRNACASAAACWAWKRRAAWPGKGPT